MCGVVRCTLLLLLLAACAMERSDARKAAQGAALRREAAAAAAARASPPLLRSSPPRRRVLVDLATPGDYYQYVHLPFVNCANTTSVLSAFPWANFTPACCAESAQACAARCTATAVRDPQTVTTGILTGPSNDTYTNPSCIGFRYARSDPTPPPAGLPAPPAGASWSRCELFFAADVASCVPSLVWEDGTGSIKPARWLSPLNRVVWDTYLLMLTPGVDMSAWHTLSITVGGLSASELDSERQRGLFVNAVQFALQARCCVVQMNLLDVAPATAEEAALFPGEPAVSVLVALQTAAITEDVPFLDMHITDVLTDAAGRAELLQRLRNVGFTRATAVVAMASPGGADIAYDAVRGAVDSTRLLLGLCISLGGSTLLLAAALVATIASNSAARRQRTGKRGVSSHAAHDVFLSYRRKDLQVADATHDKLTLAGLRVFYDRDGSMCGRPFERELFKAIAGAPVFAPIITLESMRLWASLGEDSADYPLAEFVVASQLTQRSGATRHVVPLLVGEWRERLASAGGGERDYLPSNHAFQALVDTLPAVVPRATLALAASMLTEHGNHAPLDACLSELTVRELLLGREPGGCEASAQDDTLGGAFVGLLQFTCVALHGPHEQAGLVLRHRYAEIIVAALSKHAAAGGMMSPCW